MILAGGFSRRMGGTPKGLEVVGGLRVVDRVMDALAPNCSRVVLAANDERASTWLPRTEIVRDLHAGAGGLAGVEAAIEAFGSVIVVAWDMPFVTSALLRELIRRAEIYGADVVIPESDSPHGFEPFCACYSARVLPQLKSFVSGDSGSTRDFIATLDRVHRVPLRDVSRFGDPATLFFNVNSPADLERARTIAERAG